MICTLPQEDALLSGDGHLGSRPRQRVDGWAWSDISGLVCFSYGPYGEGGSPNSGLQGTREQRIRVKVPRRRKHSSQCMVCLEAVTFGLAPGGQARMLSQGLQACLFFWRDC